MRTYLFRASCGLRASPPLTDAGAPPKRQDGACPSAHGRARPSQDRQARPMQGWANLSILT